MSRVDLLKVLVFNWMKAINREPISIQFIVISTPRIVCFRINFNFMFSSAFNGLKSLELRLAPQALFSDRKAIKLNANFNLRDISDERRKGINMLNGESLE